MLTVADVWPFMSKMGQRKICNVWRNCMVAEGEFRLNKMCILMMSATGEPSANGDELAMVT
jgi:hypothetical protein